MEKEKAEKDNLKEDFLKLKEKYSLPDFEKLCEDFDIEKLSEKDSMFLLRDIRRTINEKLTAYINLLENLINPSSPSIFVFSILRGVENKNRSFMKIIYKSLARTQLEVMKLDTQYDEEGEAKFILESFKIWQSTKPKLLRLIDGLKKNFEKDVESKRTSYFD